MSFDLPPAVKLAETMLKSVEQAVMRFSRYHKYQHGAKLREKAWAVAETAHRACRIPARRAELLGDLVGLVDDLKLAMQLCKEVKAFRSYPQFEAMWVILIELGKQVGGWKKQQHAKGQNEASRAASAAASPQRAQILSARAASTYEAHP